MKWPHSYHPASFLLLLPALLLSSSSQAFLLHPTSVSSQLPFALACSPTASRFLSTSVTGGSARQGLHIHHKTSFMSARQRGSMVRKDGAGIHMSARADEEPKLSFSQKLVKGLEKFVNANMERFVQVCPRSIMAILAKSYEKRNWYDRITDKVICGALPYSKLVPKLPDLTARLVQLREEGVTHVVNMVAEWGGPEKEYQEYGIVQKRFPVIDFTPPTLEDIENATEYISKVVEGGGTVYVHCKAGRGRAASVCMAYLIKERKMSLMEAQKFLEDKRPHVLHMLYKRPVLREFASKVGELD
ncbi:hypothetical protein GUITHDRAFT_144625 [Guillardia theta CCMP2712]|uniref:Uncharacterized protein n=1 Tax=Guillardia theta (strain CCMP2712) TaxID=905079 RepID=L1IQ42_GUITC|nr:hypothetical protein GUITHDRAFT_144625 [Guillardia theta CCMP2712]EKX37940.1 hypothetical protein GUITHDRAFT_144625 [Guillardia theta CCMP2712]|eukprot:XP_005824920.1 hypothetical protein GUITHDRAFT_144625 [Guillardia theta CCMP2712]